MISEVERSVKNPTVKVAYEIARALGCSLTDLLENPSAAPARILRAADRLSLIDDDSGVERHGLAPGFLSRGLELVLYVLPASTTTGAMAPNRDGIVEHVSVLDGRLELRLGDERHELDVGDGASYGPQTEVEYRNVGRGTCRFVLLADTSRAR